MGSTWEEIKTGLRSKLPTNTFSLWIDPITFLGKNEKSLTLGCPNKFSRTWVTENYLNLILEGLRKAGSGHLDVVLKAQAPKKESGPTPFAPDSQQLTFPNIPVNGNRRHISLNRDFTFDRFIVGPSNEFAYSASSALAHGDTFHYHWLLILAQTGLGKTHLSQAVAHTALSQHEPNRVYYITAEEFMNEMIYSLKNSRIEEFKNRYRRGCDVLLLDEIQFLGGKEKTQLELGYTLDALANDNKKVIFTSSLPPKDIPGISTELSSRLASGLLATIGKPDYNTRVNILKRKSKELNLVIPEKIIHFLADRLKKDIRQMESALKCLRAKSELLNAKIDLDLAKDAVNCLVSADPSITMEGIMKLVSQYYKVTPQILESKSRKKDHVYPRNIFIYLCRRHTPETLENIARAINRSHSTVLYASELVEHKMKSDLRTSRQIDFLSKKLVHMET